MTCRSESGASRTKANEVWQVSYVVSKRESPIDALLRVPKRHTVFQRFARGEIG